MQKTKIKICGIKSANDVNILNEFLPDFAGFVLAPGKRKITLFTLSILLSNLDKRITPVGVFVNEKHNNILEAIEFGIKIVQLHGDEDNAYIESLSGKIAKDVLIWKACRIGENHFPDMEFSPKNISAVVLDKYSQKQFGGLGETFDWDIVRRVKFPCPMILAGGLNIDNVIAGIKTVRPWGVDVSSGMERNGKKNREQIKSFISKIREKN